MLFNENSQRKLLVFDNIKEILNIVLQTAILSDSLFRLVLHGLTSVPEDWFVNCTPGATFADIEREINGVGIPPGIENIFAVCGTNYQN